MSLLAQSAIFLGAAVLAVVVSKRLGFGSVLGYLAAGAAIGPWGLRFVGDVEDVLHFAEFGVVLLLFIIGLELQPGRLWTMRRQIFGLGALQAGLTAAALTAATVALGLPVLQAVVVSLALSLSSTAFALQTLAEKGQLTTRYGRGAFSILLFQDMAAIPIIALIPLLAVDPGDLDARSMLTSGATVLVALVAVVVAGRFFLGQVLRVIAATGVREVFTATALLVVIGTALLMEQAGLSMALGAFVAGVLLADSEFRHALEADIEPFKGLLLGLFFVAIGMSINFGIVQAHGLTILGVAFGLVSLKLAILYGLGRFAKLGKRGSWMLAISLSQGGEFGFVIFNIAAGSAIMGQILAEILTLIVTLSMALTPLLFFVTERFISPAKVAADYEIPEPEDHKVIIAGFGRFGQIVGRVLRAKRIGFTALEISSEQVNFVMKYGNKVYYGDASRLDLLRAAGADTAKVFVLAIDDVEASVHTAETVTRNFPNLTIYARARNREHAYRLLDLGIEHVVRETFHSSLQLAREVLGGLGTSASESNTLVATFREHDEKRLLEHRTLRHDEAKMVEMAKEWAKELEALFEQDTQAERPAGTKDEARRKIRDHA